MYPAWGHGGMMYAGPGGCPQAPPGYAQPQQRPAYQPQQHAQPQMHQACNGEGRYPRPSTQLREIALEYSHTELSEATSSWSETRRLGSGSYGSVFKGELEDGSEVAIKAIDLGALSAAGTSPEMSGFEDEVQMLSKFRHPNLVTLLGWGKHQMQRFLVYELLAGGDCFQRLAKSKKVSSPMPFHWFERLSVCLDAATGLSHMHNSKPKAFHRDIKSANILLDRHGTAKMADFGLSCTSSRSDSLHITVRTISGTPGYACPVYSRTGRVTEGSEVYSFGMVMLELLTGLAPATADPSRPGGIAYLVQEAISHHSPGALERLQRNLDANAGWPAQLAAELGELALRAVIAQDEGQRPRFVELVRTMRKLGERFPKPTPQTLPQTYHSPQTPQHLIGGSGSSPMVQQPSPVPQPGAAPGGGRASGYSASASSAGRPTQVQPRTAVPAAASNAPPAFFLELVSSLGLEISSLPSELRSLPVAPSAESSASPTILFPIGRTHQSRAFEAWVPDQQFQFCISRNAFEIACGPKGENAQLFVRGTGMVSVDGRIAPRETGVSLRPGSEIGFNLNQPGDDKTFLRLRFRPAGSTVESQEASGSATPDTADRAASKPAAQTSAADEPGSATSPSKVQQAAAASVSPPKLPVPAPAAAPAAAPVLSHSKSPAASSASSPSRLPTAKPPETGTGSAHEGPAQWALTCVYVEGLSAKEVEDLPRQMKEIPVAGSQVTLGRLHQNQLEQLVTAAAMPQLASLISRKHAQLEIEGSKLRVTNLSSNPLYVDEDSVTQGTSRLLAPGQMLSFARAEDPDTQHIKFLKFQAMPCSGAKAVPSSSGSAAAPSLKFHRTEAAGSSPAKVDGEAPRSAVSSPEKARAPAKTGSATDPQSDTPEVLTTSPPQRKVNKDGSLSPSKVKPLPPSSWSSKQEVPISDSQVAARALSKDAVTSAASSLIVLELSGEGVLTVPASERRIESDLTERPLLVGRKHQPELHRRAVSAECLQFMSRDHFSISLETGEFKLLAMTSNPIWRDRSGIDPVELGKGDCVTLLPGDRIALGTGSDNSKPESAIRSLCWHFSLAKLKEPVSTPEVADHRGRLGSFGRRTPPSPGGPGPRVSEEAPWAFRGQRATDGLGLGGAEPGYEPHSPARERLLPDGAAPKAKAKSRPAS
eukprot:TRINITY_DN34258_c0_g1_i1.p1 TRINITY_DN34258_c0_g1~~TRINITY_DN34258_c0_g1_i1.p1  ORF type:complete len:1161 (+),score=212.85 TRINITY_DN34258_c0_g1_i1:140-3622(+)